MIAARSCVSGKARSNTGRDARYVITDVTRPPQRPLPNGRDEALPRPCDGWSGWLRRRLHSQRHVVGSGGVSARGGRLRAAARVGRGPDQRAGGAKKIKAERSKDGGVREFNDPFERRQSKLSIHGLSTFKLLLVTISPATIMSGCAVGFPHLTDPNEPPQHQSRDPAIPDATGMVPDGIFIHNQFRA